MMSSASAHEEHQPLLYRNEHVWVGHAANGERRLKFKATVLLPCVVTAYFILYVLCHSVLYPFIYDKISSEYPSFNSSSQAPCSANMTKHTGNTTDKKIQEDIERRVSTLELHLGLTGSFTAVLPLLFLGPLTDRLGRRIGFLLPIAGTLLKCVLYAVILHYELSVNLLFLAHVVEALGGSFAGMLTAMFSVISDVTEAGPRRSLHITCMEAGQTLVQSFAMLAAAQGVRLQWKVGLLVIGSGFGVIAVICAIVIPNTGSLNHAGTPDLELMNPWRNKVHRFCVFLRSGMKLPLQSFKIYIQGDKHILTLRRLVITAFILTVAVNFAKPGVWQLYLMKYPLCWSASDLLTLSGAQITCNWAIILVVITLLQRLFKMADRQIVLIGCISSMISASFASVAVNDRMVYEVAVLSVMIRVIIPMLRSIISATVDSYQQGALYAGMGCIEALGAGVFGIAANRIYFATLSTFAGTVFVVFAALMFITLILLLVLNVIINRSTLSCDDSKLDDSVQDEDIISSRDQLRR